MGKDRRQKAFPFAVAELRPNPWLSLCIRNRQTVEEIFFQTVQALLTITAPASDAALLRSLGDDLRFVTITSGATVVEGEALAVQVSPATAAKCERCWHYRDDVGSDAAHPTLCGRCTSNLFGAGEVRTVA